MKHTIFVDLDGTLYDHSDFMHPDVPRDISFAQSKGVEVVFCTGNGAFPKITNMAKKLNVRYIISSNGSWIYDLEQDETIYKNVIPYGIAKKLIDHALEIKANMGMWDEDYWYATLDVESKRKVVNKYMGDVDMKLVSELNNDVFLFTIHSNPEIVDSLINKAFELGLTPTRIRDDFAEISFGTSSKGSGIKEFCKMKDLDLGNTMGIGDSHNDLSMFEVVSHSYAMDNALDEIKSAADHYAPDVKQNGLGMSIIDYLHRTKLDRGN